jgi:2-iminobutanoate/2-iminopropanoate deaminase
MNHWGLTSSCRSRFACPRSDGGSGSLTDLRFGVIVGLSATLLLTACAPGSRRQVVNPPGIAPLVPAYSVAIRHGNLVFVSGMTGIKPGTQDIIEGGVAVQTRQTLENIRAALQTAGASMADVGECTVFLLDMADYAAMNAVYIEFFKTDPPARATLAVSALPRPAARVEIKCSAVLARPR